MIKSRIYVDQELIVGECCHLPAEQSRYLLNVLRCQLDERCYLFNGTGQQYLAQLVATGKSARLQILAVHQVAVENPLEVTLVQAVSRGDRMDYAIQKSVECGVHKIIPVLTARCGVKLTSERALKRQDHWQKVAISAAEQSGRVIVPAISAPIHFDEWLPMANNLVLVADFKPLHSIDQAKLQPNACSLLIGPEGGFSDSERKKMYAHQFYHLDLGPRILRTETAPVVALTILNQWWGDLK